MKDDKISRVWAKAITGIFGCLAVFGVSAITGDVTGLWALILVIWMVNTVS